MDKLPGVVYLDVVGCPENRYDVDQLRAFLVNRGVKITTNPREADTLIVNTCGLTQMNENLSKKMIAKIKENASPDSRLIISGCLPKIHPDSLKDFKEAYIIPGPVIESIPWICDESYNDETDFSPFTFPQRLILEPEKIWNLKKGILWSFDRFLYRCTGICPPNRVRYYIKIATGCNRHCTYCAIRISRGPLRSKPAEWIVERFKEGISSG
ncbi:hypothetical protein J7M23_05480, partial [Candidatus Sumerlaeota bacterium]|nr:hypothetical protein [Candidatus Sumerlaeota bacterium]